MSSIKKEHNGKDRKLVITELALACFLYSAFGQKVDFWGMRKWLFYTK